MSEDSNVGIAERSERPRTLRLSGAVDVARVRPLLDVARSCGAGGSPVIIECSAVERLDAAGLQVLLALAKKLRSANLDVKLRGPSEAVLEAVRLAGVETELPIDEG
ncbi:MAG: STAS domain-containing protein [Polyangiaceae bacterium]|jgi:anti-anti-sigma factor